MTRESSRRDPSDNFDRGSTGVFKNISNKSTIYLDIYLDDEGQSIISGSRDWHKGYNSTIIGMI